ncbi:MAG: hypothetical protein A2W35_09625 [Chloroflexi bacterium RBG_16_57_11]|nr:MAG: hypothetical protein A2W35_09625 [Chloroflexi bacterium RBG_16_57_11]
MQQPRLRGGEKQDGRTPFAEFAFLPRQHVTKPSIGSCPQRLTFPTSRGRSTGGSRSATEQDNQLAAFNAQSQCVLSHCEGFFHERPKWGQENCTDLCPAQPMQRHRSGEHSQRLARAAARPTAENGGGGHNDEAPRMQWDADRGQPKHPGCAIARVETQQIAMWMKTQKAERKHPQKPKRAQTISGLLPARSRW